MIICTADSYDNNYTAMGVVKQQVRSVRLLRVKNDYFQNY